MKSILIIVFLFCTTAIAQNNNIVFEHLTIEDGLSQSSVKTIFQDSRGFMWFGTADGLNRYDGYNIKIFKKDEQDFFSISDNSINQITEDSDGFLWIATANGLNKYDTYSGKFSRFKYKSLIGLPNHSEEILSILTYKENKDKIIWFSTIEGIYKYNFSQKKINFYELKGSDFRKSNQMHHLYRDSNNDIWVCDFSSGLFKFNTGSNSFQIFTPAYFKSDKTSGYSAIYEDSDQNLWVGSYYGLTKIERATGRINRYKKQFENAAQLSFNYSFITTIIEVNKDYLLIGSGGASLFLFNKNDLSVQHFIPNHSDVRTVSHNVIMCSYKDKSGIIWIGTNGYGIDKFNPNLNRFNYVTQTQNGLQSYSIRGIYEDIYGKIWLSGYFGLDRYDAEKGVYKSYFSEDTDKFPGMTNSIIYSFAEDKDNPGKYLYLGTEGGGLIKFNYQKQTFEEVYSEKSKIIERKFVIVNAVYDDGEGYLWLGTDHGLAKLEKATGKIKQYRHNPKNPHSIGPEGVTFLFVDSKGNLWIGTNFGGLSLMDRKKEVFKNYRADLKDPDALSGNFVKCIFEDSRNNLWIATTNGLNKMVDRSGVFKNYTTNNGLPNNVIYSILEDNEGFLWLSTNHGLSRFNPVKEQFKNFDVKDGLQSNEFNSYAFCKTKTGIMYFGGIKGYNSFNPSNLIENEIKPPIVITDIMLFNKPVPAGKLINSRVLESGSVTDSKKILLNYKDNVITIKFASLDYYSPEKNQYKYKLEGFDNHWSVESTQRTVTYTNLDPGEYTFRVIGSNNDGIWNTQGASLKIIITPPFWQTWWFFIFAALAATHAVYTLYKWRIKRVEKTNRQLELQVKERTAELHELNESLKVEVNERRIAEEDLRLLNAQKDKFFSIVAHDLKSPFQGILGYSELLAEDYQNLSEFERISFVNDINNISKTAFRFLENLLEWSRIQTGRTEFEPQDLNLSLEIFEVFNILYAIAMQKKISLLNSVEADVTVYADKNMLSLILRNLLSNAIKFSNEGGKVIISAIEKEKFIEVTVSDNGIGISPENIKKLFRIDTQYTSKGTKNEEGTGLGLLLCKEMIEINKGSIRVESIQGNGTSFIFTLPKKESAY